MSRIGLIRSRRLYHMPLLHFRITNVDILLYLAEFCRTISRIRSHKLEFLAHSLVKICYMSSRLSVFSSTAIALLLRAISSAFYGVNLKSQISNLYLKHYLLQYALISLHGLTGPLSRLLWRLSLNLLPVMAWSSRLYSMHFSQALLGSISSHAAASLSATTYSKDMDISAVLSATSACCSNAFISLSARQ
jgi:hypothetical protein